MTYFTADLHFWHEKIIIHTHRPFHSVEEMNRVLRQKWNDRISPEDDVYILGDFTMKGARIAAECLQSLRGKKHLVRGNHDHFADSAEFQQSLFVSIQDYAEITCCNTKLVLCHYPITEWNGFYKGAVMLHGHQHNSKFYNIENRRKGILQYDVGVDANDMAPISADEIIQFFHAKG